MKQFLVLCALSCCLAAGMAQESAISDTSGSAAALSKSRLVAQELLGRVRTLLLTTMAEGGPVTAITVCADTAQELIRRIQSEHGATIRRVSDRWRNSADLPDGYEAEVLAQFAGMKAEGTLRETTEHFEAIPDSGGRVFRYMRPIMVQDVCLTCHGDRGTMKDLINTVLQDRYPADRAVGYRKGDLRGAVSVILRLGR